jgi:hypothetical protein
MPASATNANKSFIAASVTCAFITIAMMIWPSDAPWGGDDALLMKLAAQANHQHHLCAAGLGGSFGYPYGPVPLQIYQGLLLITHHLPTLVQLRAGLVTVVTAAALLWLTRTLRWSPWLSPLSMLSPFFWLYSRLLWDNTFAIPIGALLAASYVSFLNTRSKGAFVVVMACAAALPFIHPMTLPLVFAVGIHALWHHRGQFWRQRIALSAVIIITLISNGSYCLRVLRQMAQSPRMGVTVSVAEQQPLTRPAALAFPLMGGRLLSAYNFYDSRGSEPGLESTRLARIARDVSILAFPLVWLGIAVCLARCRAGSTHDGDPADALAFICILALILQSLLDGVMRIAPWPHYFCGTWIVCVVFLWQGLRALNKLSVVRLPIGTFVGVLYAAGTTLATAAFVIGVHRAGGGTVWYGPTMGKQLSNPDVN